MSPVTHIQLFGERSSGTNYLEHLLRDNLISTEINWDYGWKHFFYRGAVEQASHCLFIVIYRDPFDWLSSLHRRPHHAADELKHKSFSEFIRKEWRCVWNKHSHTDIADPLYNTEMMFERDPESGKRFANVMRLRSAKIKNWDSLKNKVEHTYYINYASLLENPQQHIDCIAERFNIRQQPMFTNVTSYKGKNEKTFKPKRYPLISTYDIDYIARELDADLERRAGYDLPALAEHHRQLAQSERTAMLVQSLFGGARSISQTVNHLIKRKS